MSKLDANPISHPRLFSKDSNGKVRVWWMEQEQDRYRTHSGLINGTITTSEWTTAKPKNVGRANATTGEEQALAEIQSKYLKQLKTGYHSNIEDIHEEPYVQVMLAKNIKDHPVDFSKGDVLLQRKLNGNRCIATFNGLFTRKGEKYVSVPHIEKALEKLFIAYPNLVLDGELYNYDLRAKLNELSSLVRKTKNITDEDLKKSAEIVQYHIYDYYQDDATSGLDESVPYSKRMVHMNMIPDSEYINDDCIKVVETIEVNSQEQFDNLYKSFIDDGEEGAIVRFKSSSYEHKRSKLLLKVKPEDDDECLILDIKEGQGNWVGTGKIISVKWNDREFDITFKGSQEEGREFLKNKSEWVGKTVTFNYFGLTGLGIPQYGQLPFANCLKS